MDEKRDDEKRAAKAEGADEKAPTTKADAEATKRQAAVAKVADAPPSKAELDRQKAAKERGISEAAYAADFAAQDLRIREKYLGENTFTLRERLNAEYEKIAEDFVAGRLLPVDQLRDALKKVRDRYFGSGGIALSRGGDEAEVEELALYLDSLESEYLAAGRAYNIANPNRTRP